MKIILNLLIIAMFVEAWNLKNFVMDYKVGPEVALGQLENSDEHAYVMQNYDNIKTVVNGVLILSLVGGLFIINKNTINNLDKES